MKDLIEAYLEDHKLAWAPSTLKSERARLQALKERLSESPKAVYEYLVSIGQKPYSIKTTFIRICHLEKWAKLEPRFKTFMEKHVRRFRPECVYEKEEIKISYEEAQRRIETLPDPFRGMARTLLNTGCRLSEVYTARDGRVVGKGGRIRKVYGTIEKTAPKATFTRKLKAVGLKPHTLRKLCATRLAEKGATAADLCKILGWTSIGTAYQYLQAREESKLESLMAACKAG